MKSSLSAILITLASTVTTVFGVYHGHVKNNCPFNIYARSSRGNGGESGETTLVSAHGGTYEAFFDTILDQPGISIKLERNNDPRFLPGNVYQIEYAQYADRDADVPRLRINRCAYDLSVIDGNPFTAVQRRLEIHPKDPKNYASCMKGQNTILQCSAGEAVCGSEWQPGEPGPHPSEIDGDGFRASRRSYSDNGDGDGPTECFAGDEADVFFTLC